MSKCRRFSAPSTPATSAALVADPAKSSAGMEAFTFGDPEPVLDRSGVWDFLECTLTGDWWNPPVSLDGLATMFKAAPHHASAIHVKVQILTSTFQPHPLLSRLAFSSMALDFLVLGNAYLHRIDNLWGKAVRLDALKGRYLRRGKDLVTYYQVLTTQPYMISAGIADYTFDPGKVFHLLQPDLNQELYGVPGYLAALNSVLLNEAATLFRRKYYKNGAHAGFILYLNDPAQKEEDITAIREALKNAKGPGNFRNLFFYSPGGKKDGIQLIPVGEVAAKDEFTGIKNISRDDILAAHRVPPQLMGIIPHNTGGFGDAAQAAAVFAANEITPLQAQFLAVNDWIGEEVVRFSPYALAVPEASPIRK